MNNYDIPILHNKLATCYKVYQQLKWLLDAYILDFFIEKHWFKLPKSWMTYFENLELHDMTQVFDLDIKSHKHVLPLALLALFNIMKHNNLSRKPISLPVIYGNKQINKLLKQGNIQNLFWKHVKYKKRHEIEKIAEFCYQMAVKTNCFYVVDLGSGLGHLSRLLSFGYGLKVCGIDVQNQLLEKAKNLDEDFQKLAKKKRLNLFLNNKPIHVNLKIENSSDFSKLLEVLELSFQTDQKCLKFGIIGLHPCGDLGANLLRLFINSANIRFINIVSCCYMKLTTLDISSNKEVGFPLSSYAKANNYRLSYHSRELACHAVELYTKQFKESEYWQLKIHCYRATIEQLIVKRWPYLKHSQLNSIKYTKELTFEKYCTKALSKKNITLNISEPEQIKIQSKLEQWKNVVMFSSIRVLIAPLIESLILFDRLLYMMENEASTTLLPIFDPVLSPRNLIISAKK